MKLLGFRKSKVSILVSVDSVFEVFKSEVPKVS